MILRTKFPVVLSLLNVLKNRDFKSSVNCACVPLKISLPKNETCALVVQYLRFLITPTTQSCWEGDEVLLSSDQELACKTVILPSCGANPKQL